MVLNSLVFHLDLDSFFVSAERLKNPELKGKPVAVGGVGRRAVIASCSYEARKFGVRSAMPTAQALRICPELIVLDSDFKLYRELSSKVFDLLQEYTPTLEAVSIDEAYLDMAGTESLFGPPQEAASKIRARILSETALTASIGMASNRLVAKVATDFCKPNNQHYVLPGTEAEFLAPLSVGVIPGCGKVTQAWLKERGIVKIADLQKYSVEVLERHLGSMGPYLHGAAWGKGSTKFNEEAQTQVISREMTFDTDSADREELKQLLWKMTAGLGRKLRAQGAYARAARLKLRYPPFETVTRSRVFEKPTQLDRALYEQAERLFFDHWDSRRPLRLLGIGFVLGEATYQLGFEDTFKEEERLLKIDSLKDDLTRRFGKNALKTGRDLN